MTTDAHDDSALRSPDGRCLETVKDKRIIIADDSETFIMYLGILMRRLGLRAVPARNGLEVLKLVTVFRPDLVLLDVSMPSMDGVTVLRHLKADENMSDIPVVMVTVRDDMETIRRCEKLGCAGYLTKPVSLTLLHEVVYDNLVFPSGRRRRSLRTPFHEKVDVYCQDRREEYFAVTLSEGGVYLRSRKPHPIGTPMLLSIPLGPEMVVEVRGAVIYQKDIFGDISSIDPGMAVAFSKISPEHADLLRRAIRDRLAGDLLEEQEEPIISMDNDD